MIRRSLGCIFLSLVLCSSPAFAQTDDAEAPYADEDEEPKPGARGTISGRITEKGTGQPLADTTIDVVGTEYRTVTDSDGKYRLEVPPGNYTVRIWTAGYQPIRAQNVIVGAGGARKVDVGLEPEATSVVEEYVIEEAPDGSSVDALALERQRSAAVGDSLGRAEMSKNPDRNAAQAARRVVGVSIVGNRFVYVRGLGERYTNALLNGAPLPSPEPDRAAVPLDMFPALVLENLTIVKTFTPDAPADFAGGSVRVETRSIPEKTLFQVSLSGGYNTQSTFRDRLSHRGGSLDWLGMDDGTRALPESIPDGQKANADEVPPETVNARGRDLNTFMSSTSAFTPPNHSLSVVAGDAWKLGHERKLGVIAAVSYGRSYVIRDSIIRQFELEPEDPRGYALNKDLRGHSGHDNVSWGAYGSVGYQLSNEHRLTLIGLHSQLADKNTYEYEGEYDVGSDARRIHNTRLELQARTLDFGQLSGDHDFPDLSNAHLDWNVSLARASRHEPDTRDVVYRQNLNQEEPQNSFWAMITGPESGRHFFSDQSENSLSAGLDWTQPLSSRGVPETKVKLGGLINLKSRNFEARRLALKGRSNDPRLRCPGVEYRLSCPDPVFVPENIGDLLALEEGTSDTDAYDAALNVYAAYLMADAALSRDLRLIVGERLEITHQNIEPYHQLGGTEDARGGELDSVDLLPAVAVVYSPTSKAKTRASLTRTLARPQLRELAEFSYTEYFGGRPVSGNPDLELTHITNADLRFEYFPTLREVLAFSFFYKHFEDPIEQVITSSSESGSLTTYQNAEGARLIGVELEARKGLDFLSSSLRDLSLITNLTLSKSRIQVTQTDRDVLTNLSRAMVHQAPYVFNLSLDWTSEELGASARVAYNLLGPRIVAVGTKGLDDIYEHARHTVDFSASKQLGQHLDLKLSGANVLNTDVVQTHGLEQSAGSEVRRYSDGAVYTLSATYTY